MCCFTLTDWPPIISPFLTTCCPSSKAPIVGASQSLLQFAFSANEFTVNNETEDSTPTAIST